MHKKFLARSLVHTLFRMRSFNNACIKKFAGNIKNKKILEIGSGKSYKGKYIYSAKPFFDSSNVFIQSDIIKYYGHKVIDATKISYKHEFDIILCANVLEHVFDFHKAITNLYTALKTEGVLIIFVPVFYPLHDEPHDYWRFTEYSLKELLKKFKEIHIKHSGLRSYPFGYYVEARK